MSATRYWLIKKRRVENVYTWPSIGIKKHVRIANLIGIASSNREDIASLGTHGG